MRAELIAVGSELLGAGREDTNGSWLQTRLSALGIDVAVRTRVGDDPHTIAAVLRGAVARAELVVLTGGLGPTEDDRTRDGLALALGAPLEPDAEQRALLAERLARAGRTATAEQLRQAERPRGARCLHNSIGTAPGLWIERGPTAIAVLPGVPSEMRAMYEAAIAPLLAPRVSGVFAAGSARVCGRIESEVDRALADLPRPPGLALTLLAGTGGVEVHWRVRAADPREARARAAEVEAGVRRLLGEDVVGTAERSLAEVVGELLARRRATVATAESCTGGLVAAALTAVPGASGWFRGGLVVYADDLKRSLAGLDAATLEADGAVSEGVARALAAAAVERCGADHGLGLTGVAGPGGGSATKPVGRVHLALRYHGESLHWRMDLSGDRGQVRRRAVTRALDALRRRLLLPS